MTTPKLEGMLSINVIVSALKHHYSLKAQTYEHVGFFCPESTTETKLLRSPPQSSLLYNILNRMHVNTLIFTVTPRSHSTFVQQPIHNVTHIITRTCCHNQEYD